MQWYYLLIGLIIVCVCTSCFAITNKKNEIEKLNERLTEFDQSIWMILRWKELNRKGIKLSDILTRYGYFNISIYGMGRISRELCAEIENEKINIAYGIDRNAKTSYGKLQIKKPNDELEQVDVVISTVDLSEEDEHELYIRAKSPVVYLKDLIMNEM